jgi:hypothetical protein
MESLDRMRILKQEGVGYSRRDIQEGIQQVDKERRKRQQMRNWLCFAPLEEATETIQRFVLHSIVFRSNHHQQQNRYVVRRSSIVRSHVDVSQCDGRISSGRR